jgi:hypothetical protein
MPNPKQLLACTMLLLAFAGCGGPAPDARENRKSFEMLLTAISIKSSTELEKDAMRIEERHSIGVLSDAKYRELRAIIEKARAGDWGGAEETAYDFREKNPFFK